MYTIVAYITGVSSITRQLVYDPRLAHAGYVITAGTVDAELGKAGSASITVPKYCGIKDENGNDVKHPAYDSLQKMKTIVQVMDGDTGEIFYGRILREERGLDGRKKLFLEGALTFLIDRVMPPMPRANGYKYDSNLVIGGITQGNAETFFGHCINTFNEQTTGVEPLKMFHLANTAHTETYTYVSSIYGQTALEFEEHEYSSVQDALYKKLVDVCGGYVKARYIGRDSSGLPMHTIDLVAEGDINNSAPGAFHRCPQDLRIGKNILDLSADVTGEELATVIVPLGKMQTEEQTDSEGHKKTVDLERINIASNNPDDPGEVYVRDVTAQGLYGNIWQTVVFDDIEDPSELYTQGKAYLDEHKNLSESLTVRAVDMALAGFDVSKIRLGDYVKVFANDIQAEVQCVKIKIDLLNPASNAYTFESTKKTMSGRQSATESSAKSTAAAIADSGGMGNGDYTSLEQRVLTLEKSDNIDTTTQTTVTGIYNTCGNMKTIRVYAGSTVTDKPHEQGESAVNGVLEIRRISALVGNMTFYADNGDVWHTVMTEDPQQAQQQLLGEWQKAAWDT